ncbi:ABC transporter permease [Catalinimonas sp. 4WD22]|uniref:ABC transporter permease n=1 Tax=Catalinimonas locisalis TaxID=3133978 RepID=UPI0031015A5E
MIKRFANHLFRWFCHPDYYDEIAGDLEEMYQRNLDERKRFVQWVYLFQVIGLYRPSLIRSFPQHLLIHPGMFRNYFKISTRNLLQHKMYSVINILGLALGLSAFLLINEYIRFEESYDTFFSDSEQIYRLSTVQVVNGEIGVKDAMTYHPAAKVLSDELPEVENYTVTYKFGELIYRQGKELTQERNVISADANFFGVFDYEVLQGSPDEMLSEPNSLVLTQSKADFYFGEADPVGKTLEILGQFNRTFKVTGVMEDVPENTHYKFDMLISDESIKAQYESDDWNGFNYYSYLKLKEGTQLSDLDEKLEGLSKKYLGGDADIRFDLYPITDIHLNSDYTFEAEIPGSEKSVTFTRIIALFIIFIAWINYINLSTARAVNRAKEVGLRKVVGAYKIQLMGQFLFEALLVNLLAALIALLVSELSLPYFRQLIGKELLTNVWNHYTFLLSLLLFFVIGTLASGFYPALVLSGFKPAAVLKGKYRNSKSGTLLRKALVVTQFTASMVLIAGTFIVYHQLQYMQNKDLGISTDYVVGFRMPRGEQNEQATNLMNTKLESFREVLRKHSAIETVGGTSNLPGGDGSDINSAAGKLRIVGLTERQTGTTYIQYNDEHFLDAVDMELLVGRNFDQERTADSLVVMVNQAFLRKFNINEENQVLNEYVQFGEDDTNRKYEIIGVVKDFNRTSLKSSVEPTLYFPDFSPYSTVVKLEPGQYQEGLEYLSDTWNEFFPDTPFDYTFLDERFAALYEQDRRFGEIFGTLSALAIFIAILGLFGLSSFMAVQRTTEVGVRKVLGASIPNIIGIFYKEFLILLSISGLIAIPATYWGMNSWLKNYAFRIDFPWLVIMLALCIVMLFALITVGYQIYQVAILDPAKTLRDE